MWQPTASIATLKKRAAIIDQLRAFFKARQLLEVETPLLSTTTVTDPHIASMTVDQHYYLQTSPEFYMKRLLAAGSGSIFQIGKSFRGDEVSARHRGEFTLLEWYRLDFDHFQLMDEIDALLKQLANFAPAQRISYQALFEQHLGINPHQVTLAQLQQLTVAQGIDVKAMTDKDDYLQLLFSQKLEPLLQAPSFIYHYPASQAALAIVNNGVAERFELYINGIELANGFHELCHAKEQSHRFLADLDKRQQLGLPPVNPDQRFLAALEAGLPACAGVAMGIDRLLMILLKCNDIANVLSFANQ